MTDWLAWAAALARDRATVQRLLDRIADFANETIDWTPFCTWYDTHDAREQSFHNRTVIGGVFMPLLKASVVVGWPASA